MRKSHLVILPGARSLTQIGALLLFLACPNIAFVGRDRQDIQPSCSFSTMSLKWLQKKPESEFFKENNQDSLNTVFELGKESVYKWNTNCIDKKQTCNGNKTLSDFQNTFISANQLAGKRGGSVNKKSTIDSSSVRVLRTKQLQPSQRLEPTNRRELFCASHNGDRTTGINLVRRGDIRMKNSRSTMFDNRFEKRYNNRINSQRKIYNNDLTVFPIRFMESYRFDNKQNKIRFQESRNILNYNDDKINRRDTTFSRTVRSERRTLEERTSTYSGSTSYRNFANREENIPSRRTENRRSSITTQNVRRDFRTDLRTDRFRDDTTVSSNKNREPKFSRTTSDETRSLNNLNKLSDSHRISLSRKGSESAERLVRLSSRTDSRIAPTVREHVRSKRDSRELSSRFAQEDKQEFNNDRRDLRLSRAKRSESLKLDKRTELTNTRSLPARFSIIHVERRLKDGFERVNNRIDSRVTKTLNTNFGFERDSREISKRFTHDEKHGFNKDRLESRMSPIKRIESLNPDKRIELINSRSLSAYISIIRRERGLKDVTGRLNNRITARITPLLNKNERFERDSREIPRRSNLFKDESKINNRQESSMESRDSERFVLNSRNVQSNSRLLTQRMLNNRRESVSGNRFNNRGEETAYTFNKNNRLRRDTLNIKSRLDVRDNDMMRRNSKLSDTASRARLPQAITNSPFISYRISMHRAENEITRLDSNIASKIPETIRSAFSRDISRNDILTNSRNSKLSRTNENQRLKQRLDNSLLQSRHLAQRISDNQRDSQLRSSVERDDRHLDSIISSKLSDNNRQIRDFRNVRGKERYRHDRSLIESDRQFNRFSHASTAADQKRTDRLVRASSSNSRLLSPQMENERRDADSQGKLGKAGIRFDTRFTQSRDSRRLTRMTDLFRDDLSISINNLRVSRLKRNVRISDDDKSSSIDYSRQMNRRMSMELRESKSRDELKRVASRVNSRISTRDDSRNTRALNELTRRASQLHKNDRRLIDYRRDSRMTNTERLAKFDTSAVSTSRLESRRLSTDEQESGDIFKRISPINSMLTEISRDSDHSRRDFRDLSRRAAYFGDDMVLIFNRKSYSRSSSATRRERSIRTTPSSQRSYQSQSLDNVRRISKRIDSRISFENESSRRESRTVSRRTYLIREDISKSSDNRQVSDLLRANRNKRSVYEDSAVTSRSISRTEQQDNFRRTNDRFSTRLSSSLGRTERNAFKSEALKRRTDLFRDDMAILSNERLTRRNGISLSVRESLSRRSADQYRLNTIVGSRRSSNSRDNSIFDSRNLNNRFDQFRDDTILSSSFLEASRSSRSNRNEIASNAYLSFVSNHISRHNRKLPQIMSRRIDNRVDTRQSLISRERNSFRRNTRNLHGRTNIFRDDMALLFNDYRESRLTRLNDKTQLKSRTTSFNSELRSDLASRRSLFAKRENLQTSKSERLVRLKQIQAPKLYEVSQRFADSNIVFKSENNLMRIDSIGSRQSFTARKTLSMYDYLRMVETLRRKDNSQSFNSRQEPRVSFSGDRRNLIRTSFNLLSTLRDSPSYHRITLKTTDSKDKRFDVNDNQDSNTVRKAENRLNFSYKRDIKSSIRRYNTDFSVYIPKSHHESLSDVSLTQNRRTDSTVKNVQEVKNYISENSMDLFSLEFDQLPQKNKTIDMGFIIEVFATLVLVFLMATEHEKFSPVNKFNRMIRKGLVSDFLDSTYMKYTLKC